MSASRHRVPITVYLESFEGPLDLLLYLIQTHELDISTISISKITDQYLEYIQLLQELNFDVASDFLVMAATLLYWKSRSLLPITQDPNAQAGEEDGELTQEELVRRLLEHQRFLAAGQQLAQAPLLGLDVFVRTAAAIEPERTWREMNVSDLTLSFQDSLVRVRRRKQILRKETVSLSEKIMEFADQLELHKVIELLSLMGPEASKPEVVVTFLASLELARLKKLKVYQNQIYAPIYIELIDTLQDFDVQLAVGFNLMAQMGEKEVSPPPNVLEKQA